MGPVAILNHRNELLPRAPRLLILEQDAAHAERVLRELQEAGIQSFPSIVENIAELAAALHSGEFDLALLDCTLRNGDCPEEVEMLRLTRNKTPFVLLTQLPEEAAAAQCIKCGASDYILKERLTRLPFAVKRALHEHELLQESTRTRAALKESEMRVRDLIENAAFGTFRAGVDGRFQSANETMLRILAYTNYAELQALKLANDVFRYAEAFLLIVNGSPCGRGHCS